MSEFQIRILTPADWAVYKSIRLASLVDSPDSFGSTYEREAMFQESEWQSRLEPLRRNMKALPLIAAVDGTAVGLASGLIQEPDLKVAHIYQMWVCQEERGKGIAKLLLDHITAWAETENCDSVVLSVTTTNDAAVGLYLSSGFVQSGQVEELRDDSALKAQPMVRKLRNAA